MSTSTKSMKQGTETERLEVGSLLHLPPETLVIRSNVRRTARRDPAFEKSIKERGVLEVITIYQDEDLVVVVDRGERRTLAAVKAKLPTVPVRVVEPPTEVDRIVDQLSENLHRQDMVSDDVVAGFEQLALAEVSPAQIAKQMGVKRSVVDASLAVASSEQTRARLAADELTLDQAAIFAEFEHDPEAVGALDQALRWGRSLEHAAQRLRDAAADAAALAAEVERLRGEGLPVLDPEAADDMKAMSHRLDSLVTADGEPVPEDQWPSVAGAAVVVVEEWDYPETDEDANGEAADTEPVRVYVPVWVTTDPEQAGLVDPFTYRRSQGTDVDASRAEADIEAKKAERRTVLANNKAWRSAEPVRREWLAGFVTRKTPPKGAEALIAESVLTGHHTLSKAMDHRHPRLIALLGIEAPSGYYGSSEAVESLLAKQHSPKAQVALLLCAVIAAWEDTTGVHTWRNVTDWDSRIMTALVEWGYQPSEVESLLLPSDDADPAIEVEVEADASDTTTDESAADDSTSDAA